MSTRRMYRVDTGAAAVGISLDSRTQRVTLTSCVRADPPVTRTLAMVSYTSATADSALSWPIWADSPGLELFPNGGQQQTPFGANIVYVRTPAGNSYTFVIEEGP